MAPQEYDVTTWPEDLQFLFRERAAIREFDGKQDRQTAEAAARTEVWGRREEI